MSKFLLILGLVVFAYACRTFNNRYIAKAGWLSVLVASYLSGYFLTGSHAWAWFGLSLWFLFPWVEIVGRVRKLRFPLRSEVKHRFPPSREVFPDLDEITTEVEEAGFEKADDAGWKWEETDHFVRIFYHPEKKLQATISIAQQEGFVFSHANLTTRVAHDTAFVTTNYPFSFTMKLTPGQQISRCDNVETFNDMLESHAKFLTQQGIKEQDAVAQDPDNLHTVMADDLSRQVDHNLHEGVIIQADDDHFRYSWRGCFFLWFQVLKDMIRV